ncbi:MAG: T9SS type A sorting domain-containing protein, partial [Candidatus Eisenbacteria bacterium]|nr:T9SS type A sorting domain-containing protein [Candidatus Eisenbacteria bacterium]
GGDDATTGEWERVDPVPTIAQPDDDHTLDPGHICWITGQHVSGQSDGYNDIDDGATTLYSPAYDLTGATYARVMYYRWYSNNQGNAPNQDIWIVQARNNDGAWMDIENTQDNQNEWYLAGGDLLDLFGAGIGTVEFKFIASDLNEGSLVEAGVDDFMLLVEQGASGADETPQRLVYRLDSASPNPFGPSTVLKFQVPETVRAKLSVFSVDGRMVRTLLDGTIQPGQHTLNWDTRDEAGSKVAPGVYYYTLEAGSFRSTRQMVLVR